MHDENPGELVLPSIGDVETLVRTNGSRFLVTNRNGDVAPRGARELGLFSEDTRYLSHYELSLADNTLVHLSSSERDPACNRIDLMVSGVASEFLDDPQNYIHVRRLQVVDGGFHERIEIINYLPRRITLEVHIDFASDFADIFEVRGAKRARRGRFLSTLVHGASAELRYDGLNGTRYSSRLSFSPEPSSLHDGRATFLWELEPRERRCLEVAVEPVTSDAPRTRIAVGFDERVRAQRDAASRFAEESTRFRCDSSIVQPVLNQSAFDLRGLSIDIGRHRVLAAGVPWFCCPFGRDTLIAAYEALPLNPDLATSSLRALAEMQGTKDDEFTEEEPGKIFHELRFGEMVACNELPHRPYYGTIDATPLFVVVAHATYKVTADVQLVRDLAPNIRAALAWIDRRSDEGRALVTYERKTKHGLDNQGWKDSRAGVSFPDGRRAAPPIALSEVQGYCIDAYRRGAQLLEVIGDEMAAVYRGRAHSMARLVDDSFWLPEHGRYAFAVDGTGAPLPTIVSNVGHLLWSRMPPPERARATADLLTSSDSLSAYGIRTLASGQEVFNPLSYHNGTVWPHDNALIAKGFANYDLMDRACAVCDSLIAAMNHFVDRRLPELFCGMSGTDDTLVRYPVACSPQAWASAAPFLLLQAVLGLHLDGPRRQLLVKNPRLPATVSVVEIDGLRVGRSRIALRMRRADGRCHVERLDVSGEPLRTLVELE